MLSPKIRVQSHCNDVYSTMLLVAHLRGVVSQLTERHLPLVHSFGLAVETGQAISQILLILQRRDDSTVGVCSSASGPVLEPSRASHRSHPGFRSSWDSRSPTSAAVAKYLSVPFHPLSLAVDVEGRPTHFLRNIYASVGCQTGTPFLSAKWQIVLHSPRCCDRSI